MRDLDYLRDVTTLELEPSKCTGCRACVEVCPRAVFEMRDKRAAIVAKDFCIECGACAGNCRDGALSVQVGVGCATAVINGALRRDVPCC